MPLPRFLSFLNILQTLWRASLDKRKEILTHINNEVIKSLAELSLNLLKGSIPLDERQKNQFRVWKGIIKKIASKRVSLSRKKRLLIDNPRLLGAIIYAILKYIIQPNPIIPQKREQNSL